MADELDLVTQATERDSGHGQTANLTPEVSAEAVDSLDKLFTEATGEKPKVEKDLTKDEPADTTEKPGAVPDPKGEAKTGADGKPVDTGGSGEEQPPAEGSGSEGAAAEGTGVGEPVSGAVPPAEGAEKTPDPFEKIELPPHTSTKAADSFNAVKEKARAEIQARDAELATLREKVTALEGKQTVTPEEKAELEELRKFRAAAEIDKDPVFKETFVDKISANDTLIYAKLTEAGMTEKQIKAIKDMGGPTKLTNWDSIYEHLSPTQKRVIDAKLTENESLLSERDRKIAEAKANVEKYIAEKDQTSKARIEKESKIIEDTANELLGKVGWAAKQKLPENPTPEQKKAVEEANKFTDAQIETLKGLLVDRSPENLATMAIGTVQALYFRRQLDTARAELDRVTKAHTELQAKFEKVKKSGASVRTGAAPSRPTKPATPSWQTPTEDALDSLRQAAEAGA